MKVQNRINDPTDIDTDFIDKELKADKHVIVVGAVIVQFSDKLILTVNFQFLTGFAKNITRTLGFDFTDTIRGRSILRPY